MRVKMKMKKTERRKQMSEVKKIPRREIGRKKESEKEVINAKY